MGVYRLYVLCFYLIFQMKLMIIWYIVHNYSVPVKPLAESINSMVDTNKIPIVPSIIIAVPRFTLLKLLVI